MSLQLRHSGRAFIARVAVLAALGVARCACADSAFDGMSASPVWGNFQWGLVAIESKPEVNLDSHDTYWRLEGGVRVSRNWLVGVGTQEISLNSSEKLSQLYGTVLFKPDRGPWLFQAGAGSARYSRKIAIFNGTSFVEGKDKYKGLAVDLGVGRDWSPGGIDDVHLGVRLNYEYSGLGASRTGPGSYNHSRLSLGFSASFY
jgi:hypothetical protein